MLSISVCANGLLHQGLRGSKGEMGEGHSEEFSCCKDKRGSNIVRNWTILLPRGEHDFPTWPLVLGSPFVFFPNGVEQLK